MFVAKCTFIFTTKKETKYNGLASVQSAQTEWTLRIFHLTARLQLRKTAIKTSPSIDNILNLLLDGGPLTN